MSCVTANTLSGALPRRHHPFVGENLGGNIGPSNEHDPSPHEFSARDGTSDRSPPLGFGVACGAGRAVQRSRPSI